MRFLRSSWVVLLWLLFAALWYRVYAITTRADVTNAMTYVMVTVLVYGIVMTVWVHHNIAIYRKKGPRRGIRFLAYSAIHDRLGSYIVARDDVRERQAITVSVNEGRKVFSDNSP